MHASHALWAEILEPRRCLAALTLSPLVDTVEEGAAAVFRISLDAPASVRECVLVSCEAGTATLGVDYAFEAEEIVFEPGDVEKVFYVQSLSDPGRVMEGAETLTVVVTPQDRADGQLSAVVTINDFASPSPYDIEFDFDANVPWGVRSLFDAAADLWERVIVGDLPDVTLADGRVIDDLLIHVDMADLGEGVIAFAGFTDVRDGYTNNPANGVFSQNGLPYIGQMTINPIFEAAVGLGTTIAHEIGHVIGFGTLWQAGVGDFADLVVGLGTDNPMFVGENALREFTDIFGAGSGGVPLYEPSTATPPAYDGSYGSHWRDSVFNDYPSYGELMTSAYPVDGDANGAVIPSLLSRVTVGALDDLGYVVNYRGAEAYVAPPALGAANGSGAVGGGVTTGGTAGGVTAGGGDGSTDSTPPGDAAQDLPTLPGAGDVPGGGDLVGLLPPEGIPGVDLGGLMGPEFAGVPGLDAGVPTAGSGSPRSLPPRITYTDAAPLILGDNAESRERIRQLLEGYYAGGISPIDLAELAAEQIARLAAWAEFERAAAWERGPGLVAAGGGEGADGNADGFFAEVGMA